jgi:alkaline phosphatase D
MGVEFVTTSVTTPGADFISNLSSFGITLIKSQNPHMKFIDLTRKGYVILDLNHQRAQGDFYFVERVDQVTNNEVFAEGWYCQDGTRYLQKASAASVRLGNLPVKAPALPNNPVNRDKETNFFGISSFPNPYENVFDIQFYTQKPAPIQIKLLDMQGKTVKTYPVFQSVQGLNHYQVDCPDVPTGTYILRIESRGEFFQKKVIKK